MFIIKKFLKNTTSKLAQIVFFSKALFTFSCVHNIHAAFPFLPWISFSFISLTHWLFFTLIYTSSLHPISAPSSFPSPSFTYSSFCLASCQSPVVNFQILFLLIFVMVPRCPSRMELLSIVVSGSFVPDLKSLSVVSPRKLE